MAYKSIPRVNKLGTSMFWESGIFFQKYSWISIKLIVFLRYFNRFFFLYPHISYKFIWFGYKKKNLSRYYISNFYSFKHKLFTKKNIILHFYGNAIILKKNSLKTYLYQFNNKYHVFFIYLDEENTIVNKNKNKINIDKHIILKRSFFSL